MPTLVKLSTPGYLYGPHAAGYERTIAKVFAATSVRIGTTKTDHAHRTQARQVYLLKLYYTTADTGLGPTRWWEGKRWWRKPGAPVVAQPGESNHGNGNTVDFQNLGGYDSRTFRIAEPILLKSGWDNTEGRAIKEYWHWTRTDSKDQYREDDMPLTQNDLNSIVAALRPVIRDEVAKSVDATLKSTDSQSYLPDGLAARVTLNSGQKVFPTAVRLSDIGPYIQALTFHAEHEQKDIEPIVRDIAVMAETIRDSLANAGVIEAVEADLLTVEEVKNAMRSVLAEAYLKNPTQTP